MSLYKIDKLAAQLQGKDLASAHVKVFLEKPADGLTEVLRQAAAAAIKAGSIAVDVQNLDVQQGRAIVSDEFDVASEVEDFWTRLRTKVIPAVNAIRKKKPAVAIEAWLSE